MKLKTNKSISKRFRITNQRKIEKRTAGQDHYNTRETGKTGRNKRSDVIVSKTLARVMATAMPHAY